jgi:hypothetical protein
MTERKAQATARAKAEEEAVPCGMTTDEATTTAKAKATAKAAAIESVR